MQTFLMQTSERNNKTCAIACKQGKTKTNVLMQTDEQNMYNFMQTFDISHANKHADQIKTCKLVKH